MMLLIINITNREPTQCIEKCNIITLQEYNVKFVG